MKTNKRFGSAARKALPWLYLIIYSYLLFLVLEILNIKEGFVLSDAAGSFEVSLVSTVLIFIFIAFMFSLTGCIFAAASLVTVALAALYITNYYRITITGLVLRPGDLQLAGDLQGVLDFVNIAVPIEVIIVGIALALLIVSLLLLRKYFKANLRGRVLIFNTALCAALVLFGADISTKRLLPRLGVDVYARTMSNSSYKSNGVLMGFYAELIKLHVQVPADYSREMMESLIGEIKELGSRGAGQGSLPNVIAIMSESFTDPYRWKNIQFSQDPAPNLHKLMEGGAVASGNLVTPAFGGLTCNPEWEFLTGNVLNYIPSGVTPFLSYEKYIPEDDLRSLPNQFRNNGYKTVGIHSYLGDFFNRNTIYPRLGFDEYISMEQMQNAPKKGPFISDDAFTDRVLEVIESTEEPLFIYGISMQNHYEYDALKYNGEHDVKVTDESGNLNEYDIGVLESYLQGVYDADAALGKLIAELEQSGRDTIVLFFGDHQPMLGASALDIMYKLGVVEKDVIYENSIEENYFLFTTPYVVWANYDLPELGHGDMSAYFAGALISDLAGIEKNTYFNYLSWLYDEFHGFRESLFVDADDSFGYEPSQDDKEIMNKLKLLQYDYLFGEKYVSRELAE